MLQLYWGLLITGVLLALMTVILGDIFSNALDGIFDFMSGEHLHALQPMVLFSGVTVLGGAGILLTNYTPWETTYVILGAVCSAVIVSTLIYFLYVKPMQNSENSVGFSMRDMVGIIGEVSIPIPAGGYGEVIVRMGAGNTNQIAASFDGVDIQTGAKVATVEVKDSTLYVARLDNME